MLSMIVLVFGPGYDGSTHTVSPLERPADPASSSDGELQDSQLLFASLWQILLSLHVHREGRSVTA